MNTLQALFLGFVEGLTEFLPVSSTGHLELMTRLIRLPHTPFQKTFEVAIQPGAILAVVLLYWRALLVNRRILLRLIVAFVPTAVVGVLVHHLVEEYLQGNIDVVLIALDVGGVVMIVFEVFHRERADAPEGMENISYRQAFLIGVCQTLAFIPGVSRSAATILGGLAVGVRRKTAVEFSFLLAVPTMAAATALYLYKFAKGREGSGGVTTEEAWLMLVGFVTSFVIAILTIRFLLRFIKTHTFISFGVYRIAAAVLFWLVLPAEVPAPEVE
jgi:undecaprenyl-diphosphatase